MHKHVEGKFKGILRKFKIENSPFFFRRNIETVKILGVVGHKWRYWPNRIYHSEEYFVQQLQGAIGHILCRLRSAITFTVLEITRGEKGCTGVCEEYSKCACIWTGNLHQNAPVHSLVAYIKMLLYIVW
jgi:hypothetical protein